MGVVGGIFGVGRVWVRDALDLSCGVGVLAGVAGVGVVVVAWVGVGDGSVARAGLTGGVGVAVVGAGTVGGAWGVGTIVLVFTVGGA